MKLVNLTPLKEGAFGMSAKDLAATYSLERLQSIRDEVMGDMEQEAEPEGGRIADMYADQLQGIDDAIALKQPKKDVPYDVAVGKMTQDEYDEYMSTVKPDRASFEKSSKFDRMKENKNMKNLKELYAEVYETMQQGDYSAIEQGWDGLPGDEQRDIINTALSGEARPDDFEKDFDQLKSEIPDFESGVANYLGIDEGEDFRFEPEDMDNPDEDLVIIGSGYLDIKSKFGERPPQTNGEYAEIGQKVVDQLHNGDKEAALDFIYSKINEGSCGYGPDGVPGNTPGETKGMNADDRTTGMIKMLIQKEIAKLNEADPEAIKGKHYPDEETVKKLKKGPYSSGGQNAQKEGSFDKGLEDLMGKDDFEKATSNEVPGLGDTVIDDKTDISTGKKVFMQMMTQFTDEPFLIETGLKLYDAWARGEGGLKPSRILQILQDTRN